MNEGEEEDEETSAFADSAEKKAQRKAKNGMS